MIFSPKFKTKSSSHLGSVCWDFFIAPGLSSVPVSMSDSESSLSSLKEPGVKTLLTPFLILELVTGVNKLGAVLREVGGDTADKCANLEERPVTLGEEGTVSITESAVETEQASGVVNKLVAESKVGDPISADEMVLEGVEDPLKKKCHN